MIPIKYFNNIPNWGDHLAPKLAAKIAGVPESEIQQVTHCQENGQKHYMILGSILHLANPGAVVWGCGYLSDDICIPKGSQPKIHAVRGPLTRDILLKQGFECPEVYGDPALLVPRYWPVTEQSTYKVGIIPHYADKKNPWLKQFVDREDVNIIDIQSGVDNVICEVQKCKHILSSSLHGIILADAYGISSQWIELSQNVAGKGFKFRDYFASIDYENIYPFVVTDQPLSTVLASRYVTVSLNIDLDKLMKACPFHT